MRDLSQFLREDCSDRFSMTRLICFFFALNAIYLSWTLTGNERLAAIGAFIGGAAYTKIAQKKIERNILKDHNLQYPENPQDPQDPQDPQENEAERPTPDQSELN
jgi:hypothetical protein